MKGDVYSDLFYALQDDLDRIKKRFKECKVTLVVRNPALADGDVVIGDDNLDDAIAAINRMRARKPIFQPIV